jgi:hypothetical protein
MALFNYIAILGRQPELGLVELESVMDSAGVELFGRQAALLAERPVLESLGGIVKLAQVLYSGPLTPISALPIDTAGLPMRQSKTPFALSAYGVPITPRELLAAGLHLKKQLRSRGSVRFVSAARGLAVSAAELRHNQVVEDGFELLVVADGANMIVARTIAVQNIDWYSRRDYERPVRSAKVGMLPPKLAQLLVNTTRATTIADPFCGTGVVLQEARLLGRVADGSDLAPEMVEAVRSNMAWLDQEAAADLPSWTAGVADAREVVLPAGCAVVSEGYLGPNMTRSPTLEVLAAIRKELLALYVDSLRNWAGQLPTGSEVSICAPAWRINKQWHYLGLVDELGNLGYTPKSFRVAPTPLLYARDDQVVGRQLLLLRKN